MGLWDLLTKEIRVGRHELTWREPTLFRLRVKRDLIFRLLLLAGICAISTGVWFVICAYNANRPGPGTAVWMGVGLGLAAGFFILFGQRSHATSSLWFYDDHILRQRHYMGIMGMWGNMTEWPYRSLSKCLLVTGDKLGQPFHVLLIKAGGEWDIIGIPRRVDLKKLRGVLTGAGVEVGQGSKLPSEFTRGYSVPVLGAVCAAGVILLGVGATIYGKNIGFGGKNPPQRDVAERREKFPPQINPGLPPLPDRTTDPLRMGRDENAARGNPAPRRTENQPAGVNPPGIPLPSLPGGGRTNPFPNIPNRPGGVATQPRPAASPAVAVPGDDVPGKRSPLVGGAGGFEFSLGSKDGTAAVGVRYRMGKWDGGDHFSKLEPLFGPPDPADRGWENVTAKAGYVLSGMYVHAPKFVDGVQLVFMKLGDDGQLDANDIYLSDWIGIGSDDAKLLQGNGAPVVGIHGRAGAVMDAVGVIFRK